MDKKSITTVNSSALNIESSDVSIEEHILALLDSNKYAIVCTSDNTESHGALVAFSASKTHQHIYFATPISTLKYTHIKEKSHIALVIDDRANRGKDIGNISAVTAKGLATIVSSANKAIVIEQLTQQHPYLADFFQADTVALLDLSVDHYCYVTHFHEVYLWQPL